MRRWVWVLPVLWIAGCVEGGNPEKDGPNNPGGDDAATGGDPDAPGDAPPAPGDDHGPGPGDEATLGDPILAGDDAPAGDSDPGYGDPATGGDDTPIPGDDVSPGDSWEPGPDLNPGWVGGACESAADCDDPNFSETALCEQAGFPYGMCTQMCTGGGSYCPDADAIGPGTGYTMTRCIGTPDGPRCVAECDFDQSETGCRAGYVCVSRPRYNSTTIYAVCLPGDSQGWPGEPPPGFDIGEACSDDLACEHFACLPLTGGYCSKWYCAETGCPAGSTCFYVSAEGDSACLDDCTSASDCREADNYVCDQDDVCWPGAPSWDPSVGAQDCADAWQGLNGSGLSACDTVPDDYVVVRKSVRNLALCTAGSLAFADANFWVALGDPMGDKEQRGDGRTPEGIFYVASLVPNSSYYLALLLSYPDAEDATRGYAAGIITEAEMNAIQSAQASCGVPDQGTDLGGLIEVHGSGGGVYGDWTLGCMAVENDEMDEIWARMEEGDTIVVFP